MGDRGNICMEMEEGKVYFYSHWTGSDLPDVLKRSLQRGEDRWDDESYLARIIFSDMIEGSERDLLGFGIAPYEMDKNNDTIFVNCEKQMIRQGNNTWTFEEYAHEKSV